MVAAKRSKKLCTSLLKILVRKKKIVIYHAEKTSTLLRKWYLESFLVSYANHALINSKVCCLDMEEGRSYIFNLRRIIRKIACKVMQFQASKLLMSSACSYGCMQMAQ